MYILVSAAQPMQYLVHSVYLGKVSILAAEEMPRFTRRSAVRPQSILHTLGTYNKSPVGTKQETVLLGQPITSAAIKDRNKQPPPLGALGLQAPCRVSCRCVSEQ